MKFPQPLKNLKTIQTWLSSEFSFDFYVFISSFNCKKQSYLSRKYFTFLKNVLDQIWKARNTKIALQWKDRGSSYEVRQILVCFCKLVPLCLSYNCVKVLINTKVFKQVKFEGLWRDSEAKNGFQTIWFTIYLRQTAVFISIDALREKINFYFSGVFW